MRILLCTIGASLISFAYAGQFGVGSPAHSSGIGHSIMGQRPAASGFRGGSSLHPYPSPPPGPSSGGPGFTPALGGFYGINSGAYRTPNGSRHGNGSRYLGYPAYFTPYFYPALDYQDGNYYSSQPGDAPSPDAQAYQNLAAGQNEIGDQVRKLTDEVEHLRTDQGNPGPVDIEPQPTIPAVPITVVLKDGRQIEVQNYAIMNQTFWDFTNQPVRRIPIANIDVSASTRITEAKGAEFPSLSSTP